MPFPSGARAVLIVMGLGITTPSPARTRRTAELPGLMNNLLVAAPRALLLPRIKSASGVVGVPGAVFVVYVELTVTCPVNVLVPARTSAPEPVLMNPLVPAITALIVVTWPVVPVAVPPIVSTGWLAPLSSVRMLAALPLLSRVHWFDCVVSLNNNWPIIRGES